MKTYGKPFKGRDGVMYVHTMPAWKRPVYRLTVWIQWALWKCGLPVHNYLYDECTPDFNCCKGRTINET
jgi:hypothetical protein